MVADGAEEASRGDEPQPTQVSDQLPLVVEVPGEVVEDRDYRHREQGQDRPRDNVREGVKARGSSAVGRRATLPMAVGSFGG
jgi:hypothetical protein